MEKLSLNVKANFLEKKKKKKIEKKNIINLSSAELAERVVKVKGNQGRGICNPFSIRVSASSYISTDGFSARLLPKRS